MLGHGRPVKVKCFNELIDFLVYLRLTWIQNKVIMQSRILTCKEQRFSAVSVRVAKIRAIFRGNVVLHLACAHSDRQHPARDSVEFHQL